jgi:glycolate oxidase iron-sulfur subunit
MGGSFRLSHPGISGRILDERVRAIDETGAEVVTTGCMGCWMQLQDGLIRRGSRVQVRHLAEVLQAEMAGEPS